MIDPAKVCLFIPAHLKKFKLKLFEGIGRTIESKGGRIIRGDFGAIERLPDNVIPVIGCQPQFRTAIAQWQARGRTWIYWDRGYLRRVFATWLPNGHDLGVPGGYYRWTVNAFQMRLIRDVPDDRWVFLKLQDQVKPWQRDGRHIVVADTGPDYWDLHADQNWSERTAQNLRRITKRRVDLRGKDSKIPLYEQLQGAHALVTHGSVAAIESVVMGCPVFVHPDSAASLVGETDFSKIETPVYPDRERWLHSLAYNQWNERELVDGELWRLLQ